jgi:hypothetical protein
LEKHMGCMGIMKLPCGLDLRIEEYMIHEFKTDVHVVFQIDDETLEWMRWFDPPISSTAHRAHGKLVKMPEIVVGKGVNMYVKMYSNEVHITHTTAVKEYRSYQRVNPNVVVQ